MIAEDALVFGMLEGRPKVIAKRVVYDPQDGFRARPFDDNGSTTEELLIIASLSEGRALTAEEKPEKVATSLLADGKCVGVIIKCGPQGALVATAAAQQWITPFPSKRVWKIGSGDVFSAAFAHAWLQEGASILDAAWFASRTVAEYVGTRAESFAPDCLQSLRDEAKAAAKKTATAAREIPDASIYLAGPFFTTNEQWLVDEARFALREMGFKVFSPIHEIGEG